MIGDCPLSPEDRGHAADAKTFLTVQKEFGSFDCYLRSFVSGRPIVNRCRMMLDVPARTSESGAMIKGLLQRESKFVGSTICYACMQTTGMANDHLVTCFYLGICARLRQAASTPPRAFRAPFRAAAPPRARQTQSFPQARIPSAPERNPCSTEGKSHDLGQNADRKSS